ncbi:hypothetical protein UY3_05824 [Chelonia mydas]|uniref:Uncharacterized protein n=1 Tax=Chelonia mydas TaxID=8469 RepID=M7BIJ4_CHEMY|nr:hypothetical protein UY3_05824 [Chelonia mydas]
MGETLPEKGVLATPELIPRRASRRLCGVYIALRAYTALVKQNLAVAHYEHAYFNWQTARCLMGMLLTQENVKFASHLTEQVHFIGSRYRNSLKGMIRKLWGAGEAPMPNPALWQRHQAALEKPLNLNPGPLQKSGGWRGKPQHPDPH